MLVAVSTGPGVIGDPWEWPCPAVGVDGLLLLLIMMVILRVRGHCTRAALDPAKQHRGLSGVSASNARAVVDRSRPTQCQSCEREKAHAPYLLDCNARADFSLHPERK